VRGWRKQLLKFSKFSPASQKQNSSEKILIKILGLLSGFKKSLSIPICFPMFNLCEKSYENFSTLKAFSPSSPSILLESLFCFLKSK